MKNSRGSRVKGLKSLLVAGLVAGLPLAAPAQPVSRMTMFVGLDVSGSFLKSPSYDNAIRFLGLYLCAHLNGLGGLEKPAALFVGPIGGQGAGQAKTLYPIESFEYKSEPEIEAQLRQIFPKNHEDPYTDFNAYFQQVAGTIRERRLLLKPVTIVLLTDGMVDMPGPGRRHLTDYKSIDVRPLENLSRNLTLRLLYPSAPVAQAWRSQVPRQRVKLWTQDAKVMATWDDPRIFQPGQPLEKEDRFFAWVKDNVDFGVSLWGM